MKDCKIMQDLLPNYIDQLTSTETNTYIEKHLQECDKCRQIFENMKGEIFEEQVNVNTKEEVDYLKKFNKKMKLIKCILIVITVLVIIFVGNLIRKACIIKQYNEKSTKYYSTVTNFYKKVIEDDSITEIWRKDDIVLLKRVSIEGEMMWSYWGEDNNWVITNVINSDKKEVVKFKKGFPLPSIDISTIQTENIWQLFNIAFSAKMTTENVNGEECYKIHVDELLEEYITKKDFLLVKNINGSSNQIIQYRINTVTDEDIKMPNLTGYTIREAN